VLRTANTCRYVLQIWHGCTQNATEAARKLFLSPNSLIAAHSLKAACVAKIHFWLVYRYTILKEGSKTPMHFGLREGSFDSGL